MEDVDDMAGDARGDRVRALLEEHRSPLLNRIRLLMGREARRLADSGDMLHEVVIEVMQKSDRWDPSDSREFLRRATWLARNRITDKVRRGREVAFADFSRSGVLAPAHSDTPSREAAATESQELMLEALESLSPDHQRVIELRNFEFLPFGAIAAELGRSEDAVQHLHTRAIASLGAALRRRSTAF